MKSRIKLLAAVALAVIAVMLTVVDCATGGIETANQETPAQIIEDISTQEAFTLIQENQHNSDFIIIDVRTPEEFAEEHIENTINIDFYSENFRDGLNKLDRNKTYLIYCRSANRSGQALEIMKELGFGEVYNMSGGIIEWKAKGLPRVK